MTDPAAEVAKKTWTGFAGGTFTATDPEYLALLSAAREALAPVRDIHRPFTRDYPGGDGRTVCNHCLGPIDWPCSTARLAYSSEELP